MKTYKVQITFLYEKQVSSEFTVSGVCMESVETSLGQYIRRRLGTASVYLFSELPGIYSAWTDDKMIAFAEVFEVVEAI